jgi:hypothetical protein
MISIFIFFLFVYPLIVLLHKLQSKNNYIVIENNLNVTPHCESQTCETNKSVDID